jgi:hypothetical protein
VGGAPAPLAGMSLSNVGKSEILSWFFRHCRANGTTLLDHGLVLDGGGFAALAVILLRAEDLFYSSSGGRPNPDMGTMAEIQAGGGVVVDPSGNYTGNFVRVHPDYMSIAVNNTEDFGEITFAPANLPLLHAESALTDITGYCLAMQNNTSSARVIDVVHLAAVYDIAEDQDFNLTNFGLSLL